MLATALGLGVEPHHKPQIVVLRPADRPAWLHMTLPEEELLKARRSGVLAVER